TRSSRGFDASPCAGGCRRSRRRGRGPWPRSLFPSVSRPLPGGNTMEHLRPVQARAAGRDSSSRRDGRGRRGGILDGGFGVGGPAGARGCDPALKRRGGERWLPEGGGSGRVGRRGGPHRIQRRALRPIDPGGLPLLDRKSTRLNSSHVKISYAVFCLKKKR